MVGNFLLHNVHIVQILLLILSEEIDSGLAHTLSAVSFRILILYISPDAPDQKQKEKKCQQKYRRSGVLGELTILKAFALLFVTHYEINYMTSKLTRCKL